jgi:ribosomal subunit interface protein
VEIVVRGRQLDLSPRFREHAEDKLTKLNRFGVPLGRIDVEVSKESNPRLSERAFEVELTCRSKGPVIRAEAAAPDKYSALDLAFGRLEERLRRAADRRRYSRKGATATVSAAEVGAMAANHSGVLAVEVEVEDDDLLEGAVLVDGPIVVREKVHHTEPMTVHEAVDRMELVDHDFYLFIDVDTDTPCVVYRRRGFDYGLIRLGPKAVPA